jgi:glycosyltransferase involved in cell wall biosynthesis
MPPRFSVVVPTRERAQTLPFTLRTCLDQDFDDYEIVVCDNFSSPATRQVVESFASPRIRYVRAARPLAMSDNWELALQHATGEYVTVLGDDDALLSHALLELDRVVVRTGARAVRWSCAFYTWPTVALAGEGNYLALPLMRELHTVDATAAIAAVIGFRESYGYLPMLYYGAVHRDLIAELRNRTGRVFINGYPDVYSGFAFAHLAGTYVSLNLPMSVCGLSGQSNGVATLLLHEPSEIADEFHRLNHASAQFNPHPWVPDLPIFPTVPVADSFQRAKDALFPTDDRLRLDRRALAEQCVAGLWATDPDQWRTRLGVIRASFDDDRAAQQWFDGGPGREPFRPPVPAKLRGRDPGFDGSQLHIRADALGVSDVAGAARLCEQLLGVRGTAIAYDAPGHPWFHAQLGQAREQLQVSEADRAARLDVINRLDDALKASEADRAARLGVINCLNEHIQGIEAERRAQDERIRAQDERIRTQESRIRLLESRPAARVRRAMGNLKGWLTKGGGAAPRG